jgi:hypothetical protein
MVDQEEIPIAVQSGEEANLAMVLVDVLDTDNAEQLQIRPAKRMMMRTRLAIK